MAIKNKKIIKLCELIGHKRIKSKSPRKVTELTRTEVLENHFNRSLIFMHRVPARSCFKFNYDFIGTNQYPIENLNEQLFLMVALSVKEQDASFNLSPNMFRLYDKNCEMNFENEPNKSKLYYLSGPSETDSKALNRFITDNKSEEFFEKLTNNGNLFTELVRDPLEFKSLPYDVQVDVNIERLTVALNDDYVSEVIQDHFIKLLLRKIFLS